MASRPPGQRIQLQGHGTRERQQLGPREPGALPERSTTEVRRYRCIACGHTPTVLPAGVLRRRRYGATAIAMALFMFGVQLQSHGDVCAAIGVGEWEYDASEGERWHPLVQWAQSAKAGTLIEGGHAAGGTLREAAARAALAIEGHGPRQDDQLKRIWDGAFETPWRGTS